MSNIEKECRNNFKIFDQEHKGDEGEQDHYRSNQHKIHGYIMDEDAVS